MIISNYDSITKAIIAFIKALEINVNKETIKETLQNHPDYPSLLCISDALSKWNIPNSAGKLENKDIDILPTPCLVLLTYEDFSSELVTIHEINDNSIFYYSPNTNKSITTEKNEFIRKWDGLYIIAEKREQSGEVEYLKNKRKKYINSLIPFLLIALTLSFSTSILSNKIFHTFSSLWGIYLHFSLMWAGLFASSILLWHEIIGSNNIFDKMCSSIPKGNCNAVLNSKYSKIFSFLSWSEVGLFYYLGGLCLLLFTNSIKEVLFFLGVTSLLAMPYFLFSLFSQWRIIKQWCLFCIIIQFILLFGGINVLINRSHFLEINFSPQLIIQVLLAYGIPFILWYQLKPYFIRYYKNMQIYHQYNRIKFNLELFSALLKNQKAILPNENIGIIIGSKTPKHTLIKVCSPYCGHCSNAHVKFEQLINEIPNVQVKIIFTTPPDPENISYPIVKHFLSIAVNQDNKEIRNAMNDWYGENEKDYIKFSNKHYISTLQNENYDDLINNMYEWCLKMNIVGTPTIFVDGHELHDIYNIEDLSYFLKE